MKYADRSTFNRGGGGCHENQFPETKKGNSDSIKFIQSLFKERTNDPYFYRLAKIKTLKIKFDKIKHKRTKGRYQLESELLHEEKSRKELLEMLGVPDQMPVTIKIEIFKR